MSRTRWFNIDYAVTREYLAAEPVAELLVHAFLKDASEQPLVGPRGGRYEPFGPVKWYGPVQAGDDFITNRLTYRARLQGKYVRPSHG